MLGALAGGVLEQRPDVAQVGADGVRDRERSDLRWRSKAATAEVISGGSAAGTGGDPGACRREPGPGGREPILADGLCGLASFMCPVCTRPGRVKPERPRRHGNRA